MPAKKCWSESFGPRGSRVRVFEVEPGGTIHARWRVPGTSARARVFKRESLKHSDRLKARQWARRKSEEIRACADTVDGTAPASAVFSQYLQYRTPAKGRASQDHDERCARLWIRILGPRFDLHNLDSDTWDRFARERGTGAVDAYGERVKPADRKQVRPRTVQRDLAWIRSVVRWALRRTTAHGRLMTSNPLEYLALPKQDTPRRPVATQDRLEAIRKVAPQVMTQVKRPKWRKLVRSFLPELIEVVNGTGRRISAVRQLTVGDVILDRSDACPHGAIVWPASTDKMKKRWAAPINAAVREAIDGRLAHLPTRDPDQPLFPSPVDPARPASKEYCSDLLRKAEAMAGLEPLDGSLWHAYRRKWATERKHLPVQDVAAAGGWSDLTTLRSAYQQTDAETLYKVVSEPAELREAR